MLNPWNHYTGNNTEQIQYPIYLILNRTIDIRNRILTADGIVNAHLCGNIHIRFSLKNHHTIGTSELKIYIPLSALLPAPSSNFSYMSDITHQELEEGSLLQLDFTKMQKIASTGAEVVPAVVQDQKTAAVLIVGYVNEQALEETLRTKLITFWSTSRNELWVKGATSGDYLDLVEARVNCEQNSVLFIVNVRNQGSCHTKDENGISRYGCYYRKIDGESLVKVDPAKL